VKPARLGRRGIRRDPSSLIGMPKESGARARALIQAKADPNADALVKAVAGEFETRTGAALPMTG